MLRMTNPWRGEIDMLRNVDPDDLKAESIRADAEDELMDIWDAERRADEIYFGEGREQEEDEDDEND